jgi:hypothetical protein
LGTLIRFRLRSESLSLRLKVNLINNLDNFVRLDIKADSVDKADKLVESVRNFYKGFIDELLGELPEAAYVVDRLQFDVKKENDWVQLLLRSNCQELNEVIGLIVSSVDQLSDAPTELSGHLRL